MTYCRLVIAGLLCAGSIPAQQVRTLTRPDAEFPEPFTSVSGVRELKDGRVVTVDTRDKLVQVVDFKGSAPKKVGREGSGPKEYALPMALLALPGDTSLIYDPLNSRGLAILPNGEPGDFVTLGSGSNSRGPGGGMMVTMTPPRYADARGRLYMPGAGFTMGPDGPIQADSLPVLRFDRATKHTDTVAFVRQPRDVMQATGGAGRMTMRMGIGNPFTPRDEWVVTPDGGVAVIRSPEYRVDWYTPTRSRGVPIDYPKVKVSEGHKKAWRDSRKNATAIMITNNNGRTSASAGSPAATGVSLPEPDNWPEVMPPFLAGGQPSVLVAPNGSIWVARTREAGDNTPTYDVIGAAGSVTMKVALPAKTRVVGFGAGTVYAVRTDDDDLQYLQRYRMP